MFMSSKLSTFFRIFRPNVYFHTLYDVAVERAVVAQDTGVLNLLYA